jgi:cytoskeletal protein CcmA (bactofilin family)
MFGSRHQGTVIGKEWKIVGSVTADGLVWLYGQIDGELHCSSLVIDNAAHVSGTVAAKRVVVDGKVEGSIQGGKVVLKSQAQVVGDIHYQSLTIEDGACFDGRLVQVRGNGQTAEKLERKSVGQVEKRESLCGRIERVVPVEFDIAHAGNRLLWAPRRRSNHDPQHECPLGETPPRLALTGDVLLASKEAATGLDVSRDVKDVGI